MAIDERDLRHLERCLELAEDALVAGDEPFGSVLVAPDGQVLLEERNRESGGDATQHPELAIARWAAVHVAPAARGSLTVYTSGEHCPMCAAAHGWVGLGRIVYVSSTEQTAGWRSALGKPPPPVAPLPIRQVVPGAAVDGPVPALAERVRILHERHHQLHG